MANRTSVDLIKELLGRNYDRKSPLTGYLKSANVLTNNLVARASARGQPSDIELINDVATLERIECLLACHYYQRHDPGFQAKQTGRSGATFQGQTGQRFSATPYGQDACAMDYTGILSSMEKGGKVTLTWLGKPPSSQIPYVDRN